MPPADPASLTATSRGFTQTDLDWPASTDNVGVTGYHVERCQGSGCTDFAEIAAPTATHYSDTGVSPSTTYRYRVRAEDPSANLGGYSPLAVATTDAAPPPPPGLVGAWAFSEGSGTTAAEASGNGNVGTITGAQWTTQGRFGDALSFDGNGTVRVANAPSLNFSSAMTLSAWGPPDGQPERLADDPAAPGRRGRGHAQHRRRRSQGQLVLRHSGRHRQRRQARRGRGRLRNDQAVLTEGPVTRVTHPGFR